MSDKKPKKRLEEMTKEELWQLFPIYLTEHNDCWATWYAEEAEILHTILPCAETHHIGSTAIKGIWAKPIVDILVITPRETFDKSVERLQASGYILMSKTKDRASLNKGYTEYGFAQRVFHIHMRLQGDTDEIYFREYLSNHADVVKEYEALKLSLWKRFEHDRDGYTEAKGAFVEKYTKQAKNE